MVSYYTLYTHEQAVLLPRLARRGFAPGTYLSTDLDWVVEDALEEAGLEGEPHAVLELRVLEDFLVVPTEDIEDALRGDDDEEEDWEEVLETGEVVPVLEEEEVEGEFEEDPTEEELQAWEEEDAAREAEQEAREAAIEAGELLPSGILAADWPQTMGDAIKLTETATLAHRLPPTEAVVLGLPIELVEEELTAQEKIGEVWYRFNMEKPEPLPSFKAPIWKRILQRFNPWSRG